MEGLLKNFFVRYWKLNSIISNEFHCDMQAYEYYEELVTKTENFFEILTDFDNNGKILLQYT